MASRAAAHAEQRGRVRRQRPQQLEQFDLAVVIKAKRSAEQGLKPDGAVGGLGEGAAFAFRAPRIVGGYDHVDIAAGHALDHGAAVVLRAERRTSF